MPRLAGARVGDGLAVLVVLCAAASCAETPKSRSRTTTRSPPPPVVETRSETLVEPTEPGFLYCCGDQTYKLEIDCDQRLMRCYHRRGGQWAQTFGRHCKRALDRDCYLHACDQLCDSR